MPVPVELVGGQGSRKAIVTPLGQLVTAPLAYDDTVFLELAEPSTAYNFYGPKQGQQFVMTGIVAKADRDVSNTVDAIVVLYESTGPKVTDIFKTLFQGAMVRGEQVILLPLNILVSEGKYLNGKTTDDDIHVSVMGYYIQAI